jgi:hypothetical protein
MDLKQAIDALDSIARQKKMNQIGVEKIIDELLRESVGNAGGGKASEGKSKD